jgi:hypothetical protein
VSSPPSCWTSGSLGSRGCRFSSGVGSGFGFDSFGSFPSFMAFAIRTAFHLAYLILAWISGSGSPQIFSSSRKVDAARKVSAVCLGIYQSTCKTTCLPVNLLCDLVRLHGSICPLKSLKAKLLHICLTSSVVYYSVIRSISSFRLVLLSDASV